MTEIADIRKVVEITGLYLAMGMSLAFPIDFEPILNPIEVTANEVEPFNYGNSSSSQQPKVKTLELKRPYTDEELELLAHVINAEQGIEFDDEQKTNMLQIYAGAVALNRIKKHYRGAETLEDVIYTPGQYACISDVSWTNPISDRAYKNAEILLLDLDYSELLNIPKMPDDVIYQAEFTQGSGTWMQIGNNYFCYE